MRTSPPDLPGAQANDSSIDHALTLLLADETEAALRWGAAVVGRDPFMPSALVVTGRLLERMGRRRAAIEGLELAVQRATDSASLPLALAAIDDLRALGVDVRDHLDRLADAFCQGSARLMAPEAPPPLAQLEDFEPISPFFAGPALASKATQILGAATRAGEEIAELPLIPPVPLFSTLPREALRDLLAAFETVTVPAGHCVIREGDTGTTAYIVARGELEVSRREGEGKATIVLAHLRSGAFFGEMALLSNMPRAASVITTRPSILLVAERTALEAVAQRHPVVAVELAAHCRRRLVANLGRAARLLVAVAPPERPLLVERLQTRTFAKGDRLIAEGSDVEGLHLIASGEVAVIAHEGNERVVLAALGAGETVGEVELALCRKANADAIAVQPTATLFLRREDFFTLVEDHPSILHGVYLAAVRRHAETTLALEANAAAVYDDYVLGETVHADPFPAPQTPPWPPADVSDRGATQQGPLRLVPSTPPEIQADAAVASAPAVSVPASFAPTTASARPAPPTARPTRRWSAISAMAGAGAAIAGVLIAVATTRGVLSEASGATLAKSVMAAPAEDWTATIPEPAAPAPTATPTATAPSVSRALPKTPTPPRAAAVTRAAFAAPMPTAAPAPTAAPIPTATPAPAAPPAHRATETVSTHADKPSGADEFGGRE